MSNNGVPTDQAFKGHDRVLSIKEDDNRYNASKKNHYRLQFAKGVMKDGQRTCLLPFHRASWNGLLPGI